MAVPYVACMALVAQIYALPPRVLPAIHAIEGGRPGSISRNGNGSEDLGVMQVNTLWVPALARYTGLPQAEVRRRLIDWPCFNIAAAGLILRTYLNETRGDLMRAIGNYHSHTPFRNQSYQLRVWTAAVRLFRTPGRSP
ncbi:lytic transglycosylase domain-containing protein [Roseomonas sp. NAR14]|uniref:Lytic transglycosylase domain-containing protein n=1 Tax=Roseomonas acroporae TaxID=2937791 RepID=A0A9X2BWF7_9PROT|nr:lytic transglycosylase domain-containing protein [Roseomonas acroporae]MCK8787753.1 lytic transglycosylase domain-containing protein [Roseomonas acroporae]